MALDAMRFILANCESVAGHGTSFFPKDAGYGDGGRRSTLCPGVAHGHMQGATRLC